MTSIIQAMNSRGVAFATDSAVSWQSGHARPSAQKLFSLPGRQPIAFMVMGSGTFAPTGQSWDRIFHLYNLQYSEKYGAESELDTVEDYETDFIDFLHSLYDPVVNDRALSDDIWNNWAGENGILTAAGAFASPENPPQENIDVGIRMEDEERSPLYGVTRYIMDWEETSWFNSEECFSDIDFQYKTKQVETHHSRPLRMAAEWILMTAQNAGSKVSAPTWDKHYSSLVPESKEEADAVLEKLLVVLKSWLAGWGNNHSWKIGGSKADVVFGGFGKNDEFPKTTHIVTGSRVKGLGNSNQLLLERNLVDPKCISPEYDSETSEWKSFAFLEAFAQNEFIIRMTAGQDLSLRKKIKEIFEESLGHWIKNTLSRDIAEVDGVGKITVASIIEHLEEKEHPKGFSDYIVSRMNDMGNETKQEFRNAIARLSPPELAELTMDLIGVQAKMHNIVHSQSSVDLPVDVCYLSKENGFIWHKRKNVPDYSINPRLKSMKWDGSQFE